MRRPTSRPIGGLAGVLLALLVTSCSSTTVGQGSKASKSSLPASYWDEQIFLCTTISEPPCTGETTPVELSTVRTELAADPAVTHILFLSEPDALKLARVVLPTSETTILEVGDLPAEFLVSTSGGAALSAQYGRDGGVATIVACQARNQCAVSTLRAAGVVR